ncbi:hypothetical protein ACFLRM_00565 [Acidobacteriota bacterium]
MDVTADISPYIRNGIGLGSFIHPRLYARGAEIFLPTLRDPVVRVTLRREIETTSDWENWYQHVGKNWDNVLIVRIGPNMNKDFVGRTFQEVAERRNVNP